MIEFQRILHTKQAQEAAAQEEARRSAEKPRLLQMEAKLQEMAAADAATMQAFKEQRQRMDKE